MNIQNMSVKDFINVYEKDNKNWGYQTMAQLLKAVIINEGRVPDVMFDNQSLEDYPELAGFALGIELIDTEYDSETQSLFPTIVLGATHVDDLLDEDEEMSLEERLDD